MKRKAIIFLSICVMVHIGLELLQGLVYFNGTSSLPTGFYVKVPSKNYQRGDYIVYEPTEEVKKIVVKNGWGVAKYDFLKQVGAISGDTYSISPHNLTFEINGEYVGKVFETDNQGNELPKLRGKFKVSEGYVLPIATSLRSFDGRYSGTIPESRIKAKVIPILTW